MELISEQFNVHAFWSSPCTGPMFTTYRAHTTQEPKIKAENGVVRYLLKLETHVRSQIWYSIISNEQCAFSCVSLEVL